AVGGDAVQKVQQEVVMLDREFRLWLELFVGGDNMKTHSAQPQRSRFLVRQITRRILPSDLSGVRRTNAVRRQSVWWMQRWSKSRPAECQLCATFGRPNGRSAKVLSHS